MECGDSRLVANGWLLALVGAACSAALGQGQFSQGSVHYSLELSEYNASTLRPVTTPNGLIDPGEAACISIRMHYQPMHGTPVMYPTSLLVGSSGAGQIGGFWNGMFNVVGSGGAEGSWFLGSFGTTRFGIIPPFSTGGGNGTPTASGTIVENVQPAQFGASVQSLATVTGVVAWRGLWTPASYAARTVVFRAAEASLPGPSASLWATDNLYTITGFDLPVVGSVPATFGSLEIPIVPAPGAAVLLVTACGLGLRRRRTGSGVRPRRQIP